MRTCPKCKAVANADHPNHWACGSHRVDEKRQSLCCRNRQAAYRESRTGLRETITKLEAENRRLQAIVGNQISDMYLDRVQSANVRLRLEIAAMYDALLPSAETKAAYTGEITTCGCDECGDVLVSWTAIKNIMREIHTRGKAAANAAEGE